MKLIRPLVFFDTESTGLNLATDRIVSIAVVKYFPTNADGFAPPPQEAYTLVNPGIPIPPEATEVHGITNEMVQGAPTFFQISKSILSLFEGSDIGGYNIQTFDIPLLAEEFLRVGKELDLDGVFIVDPCTIFKKQEPRTLVAAMQFYCGVELEDAHNAMADTKASARVLRAQIKNYPELEVMNIAELHEYCRPDDKTNFLDLSGKLGIDADGDAIYAHGKSKGTKVKEDPKFGLWMLKADHYTMETKNKLTKVFNELGIAIKK